jgi:pimeloyl-ACP methyl ester carboxylesterase
MNVTFADEPSSKRTRASVLLAFRRGLGRGLGFLFRDIFGRAARNDPTNPLSSRILRGLSYRLLFAPLVLALLAATLVYRGTHGPAVAAAIDPTCQGMYYDTVNYLGEGDVRLEAWVVPALDAQRVLAERDRVLGERRPGVVLVHDVGFSREQMLPLVAPLHHQGYVVMVVTLRGCEGTSLGSTFGLNEAGDVEAALAVLQKTPLVDASRLAIIGIGTGANAALIAAQHNSDVRAVIIDNPHPDFDETLRGELGDQQSWMRGIDPLCRWTFEVAYSVNAADLNLQHCFSALQNRADKTAILEFGDPRAVILQPEKRSAIIDFLEANLGSKTGKR